MAPACNDMSRFTRRNFLATSAAAPFGLAACTSPEPGGLAVHADTIVTGGKLLTMDPEQTVAEAMALSGKHILAVGTDDDIRNLAGPKTTVIDATGLTVTPGFIDAHSHPLLAQEAIGVNVNLPTIAEVKNALAAKAAETPPGHWVLGVMYDDTKFEDGRPLNRRDIDEAVSEHPVYVGHRGGHTGVVNSKAFELAGLTIDSPDPKGVRFYREGGEFTGRVSEARDVFVEFGTWPLMDRAMWQKSATISSQTMAAAGLTSTTDAWGGLDGFAEQNADLIAYQDARAADELYLRVSFMPGGESETYRGLKQAGIASGFGDDMIRIGAVKYGSDGSASERTMRMSTPFEARPDDYGILLMSQEEIDAAVDDAVANNFRIGIHANGDVAIGLVLNAYERVLKHWQGRNPRFRIEHCSLVNPELLVRIKAAGVVPTPFYTYAHFHGNKWVEYGPEKMQRMFAHKSFLDHDIPVAPASDYTPGPYEPMMAIQSMVTRKDVKGRVWGPDQRISVSQAMKVCTMHGAYASFEEGIKGSLTAGKLADYVILEKDPHEVDPDSIVDIKVLRTVLGGRTTYEA
jgi:predicted amidohydrolase YtcJ